MGNNTVHSHYDLGGQLISETHSSGQFQKEYIYLYGQKIALILPDGTNPTVTISAPSDGGNALEGSPISFSASASDNEDGDVSDSIEWSSDIDGVFGNGSSVSTNSLSPGTHEITAIATDSHGSTGSASISFAVDAAPTSIDFELTVETKTYFFFIKYDVLRWTNDVGRTDIYRNNVLKESNLLSTTWSFPTQSGAVYKVCLTGTQVCSPDTSP